MSDAWPPLCSVVVGISFVTYGTQLNVANRNTFCMPRFQGKNPAVQTLIINSDEVFSDFKKLPADLSFEEGIALLRQQQEMRQANS